MAIVISVENLSKIYRLGQIGTGTFSRDLEVWWARMRRKPNPLLKIDQTNQDKCDGDEIWALRDINFAVEQGEVLGIIGRNGAGKSTLLKILSRVTAPTYGKVKVKGRIASLLEVGTGFHPELTGRENVYLNGAILGMSTNEIARKFDEIVDFAEVERFVDTPVKRYSSGMYVRLAFAVAAHLEPEILVVDEVLAVGDAEFQKRCIGKMDDVAKEGRTVLFVSHNMISIKSLCQKAVLLNNGQMIARGDVGEIIDTYLQGNVHHSSAQYDIPVDVPRQGNGEARFQSIQLIDSSGNPTTSLYLGEPLKIIVTFELFTEVSDAILEVGIVTLDETLIIQSFSTDNKGMPIRLVKGIHTANIELNVFLLPRTYSVLLGMHHERNGATMDFVERLIDFTVLNVSRNGDDQYRWKTRGYVRPSSYWKINPDSEM